MSSGMLNPTLPYLGVHVCCHLVNAYLQCTMFAKLYCMCWF